MGEPKFEIGQKVLYHSVGLDDRLVMITGIRETDGALARHRWSYSYNSSVTFYFEWAFEELEETKT